MLPEFGREWTDGLVNAFLIRAPEAVLASYARKRDDFTLDEIGLPAQVELFDRAADRLGRAPPVVEGQDVLADPRGTLSALCAALRRSRSIRRCSPGRRDGAPPTASGRRSGTRRSSSRRASRRRAAEVGFDDLPDALKPIAAAARPIYDRLARHKLAASRAGS